ncbi:hypothetical protein C475_11345 [Halosimplex carlsbadense 2-9-1]|uniref:Steroid 5-alpha reductase C-terminal domain-containing protein n=1 Tax=Halosimplex carlsbadense 2-9-1 TaxID=797114 RepID=M0CQB3_9EURY|nr:isoprenylcysteine carboxylmethyltransferase family protein [Halosimplex carlsbadense]ELZ24828.1 hypothetical protein C475_11345 [Halosimplex carlsbadense 2-9-1]
MIVARALFAVGLVAGLANTVGIVASALGLSDYYPLGERDRRFYVFWGLSHLLNGAIAALAYVQWQQFDLPDTLQWAGAGLFLVGAVVVVGASRDLGVEGTQGMATGLRTDGWYRYSRNPQYVGYLLATVGFPLWTGAPLTAPLCGIYLLWWVTFPIAEEPWLRGQYGDAYERYASRVPRFVGRATLSELRTVVVSRRNSQ